MSLKQFLQNGKVTGNILEIKIIRRHETGYYIVADSSGLGLLSTSESPQYEKDLVIDRTVKLIKPEVIDNQTIQCNKTFKPMLSKKPLNITVSENDISKLKINTESKADKNEKLLTFEAILTDKSQGIPSLTVLVTSISRTIETSRGNYQIAGIMDIESKKLNINLYDSNIGKIEFGKIYRLTKLKKVNIKKNEETETRLSTTKFTHICGASQKEQALFENVKFADKQIRGTIIGQSEMNSYNSCQKHWNKLDKEEICPKCERIPEKINLDFNVDIYVQDPGTEDIMSFRIFKRQITLISSEDGKEEITAKLDEIEGKECTIDFDDPTNEEDQIIPKRVRLH